MTLQVRTISVLFLAVLLAGCAKPQVITKTEIVEVKIPVVYRLDRPERPRYLHTDSIPGYVNKLVRYAEKLEIIIDEHNSRSKED